MREVFINPCFVPTISESFPRRDFNFAFYLIKVFSLTVNKVFKLSYLTLFVVILLLYFFFVIEFFED